MTYDIFTKQPKEPNTGRGTEFLKFLTSKASAKRDHGVGEPDRFY